MFDSFTVAFLMKNWINNYLSMILLSDSCMMLRVHIPRIHVRAFCNFCKMLFMNNLLMLMQRFKVLFNHLMMRLYLCKSLVMNRLNSVVVLSRLSIPADTSVVSVRTDIAFGSMDS